MNTSPGERTSGGPLAGVRIVELASIGPAPHAAMLLADLGADVVRVGRPPGGRSLQLGNTSKDDVVLRGRHSLVADLKTSEGQSDVLALAGLADVLIEGLRPGVAERLNIGPDVCLTYNPRLIYCRITGWGQTGPLSTRAGHDLNYIALSGALHAIGRGSGSPPPPLNLLGDYGGGSMLAVVGILAGVLERHRSGRGQIIDAAITDGVALLSQPILGLRHMDAWTDERASNILDGAAPFYDTYCCHDGRFVAVAALEPHFFRELLLGLGIDADSVADQYDRHSWPLMRRLFRDRFGSRTRDEWAESFQNVDACVTPVLTFEEASQHAHHLARRTYERPAGVLQSRPAPRFSRSASGTTAAKRSAAPTTVAEVLARWGNL